MLNKILKWLLNIEKQIISLFQLNIPLIFSKGFMKTFKPIFFRRTFLTIKNADNETTNQGCGMDIVKMSQQIYFAYNVYNNNTTSLKFIDTLIRDKLK